MALLVENGADVTVQNRRRQTPAMMAHNIRVSRLLNDAATRHKVSANVNANYESSLPAVILIMSDSSLDLCRIRTK